MLLVAVMCLYNYDSYFHRVDADEINFLFFVPCIVDNKFTTPNQQIAQHFPQMFISQYHTAYSPKCFDPQQNIIRGKTAVMDQNTKLVTFVHCWLKCRLLPRYSLSKSITFIQATLERNVYILTIWLFYSTSDVFKSDCFRFMLYYFGFIPWWSLADRNV